MARSRNLKPGFFLNEMLAECQPLARLLFAGLWCAADREGRLPYRPKRLKAELLPYDDVDVEQLITELEQREFVVRYVAGNLQFIAIPNFKKHQNPHHREANSLIPAPGVEPVDVESRTARTEASPRLAQGSASPCTGSAVLIPDSLLLIPDSPIGHKAPPAAVSRKPRGSVCNLSDAELFPGVSEQVIKDFRAIRSKKNAPVTQTAMDGIKREAAKAKLALHDVLAMCCARGWSGFEADWVSGDGRRQSNEPDTLPRLTA